ncbi:glycerophosphoryl diester phosphodiesterase [Hyphomonas neptunium ATCC 15444]|uniref:glycerophosphodiester phosphodiesterase n=2 Tax=Hyphomonas TaxID=85 RepID=Q0BZI9_HYPNA|nr:MULTISPECIES: glycerophosphodiester phosphodiesterase family protein [Hyphomonas]ABI78623.1 glycerophosphoryl diester phosphodiesterase [Hyphomonas neptunium ATCC 15444]KCZ95193.1 glycerophosphoryl diester phosphodiesterase [Hyphomonas hirschiana VP5]
MKYVVAIAAIMLAACSAAPVAGSEEALTSSAAEQAPAAYGTLSGDKPIIIAHRGASGLFPEHTIPGYEAAIDQGADFIEPDLVMTKDGVLIARHDAYLSATTDVADRPEFADRKVKRETPMGEMEDWWADDFTLAEIKTLKARQQFPSRTKEHDGKLDIVTFDEVMDVALAAAKEGRTVGLHIEAKWPGYYSSVGLDMVDPMIEAMKAKGLEEADIPVFIQSFEPEFLAAFAAKSDLPTIQNMVGPPYNKMLGLEYNIDEMTTTGVGAEKSFILNADGTTTDFIEKAHAKGLLVHVYTVRDDAPMAGYENAQAELTALIKAGADGIWVDYPETGVAVRDAN